MVDDNTLRHRERQVTAAWQKVNYSFLANAFVTKGPASDQRSLIQLRNVYKPIARDWLQDAYEDLAILTASGISYAYNTDGSPRIAPDGQDDWTQLTYAADVKPPSTNRHFRWDATSGLVAGDTASVDAADTATYDLIPEIKGMLLNKRIPPCTIAGRDVHIVLAHTSVMTRWWRDGNFRSSIVNAGERGNNNALTKFGHFTIHDLLIVPYARCFNTKGAASGSKWGDGGAVDGSRILCMGAQALAHVDLGPPEWLEMKDDYGRVSGFGIEHAGGFLKPQFPSSYDGGSVEDFGLAVVDVAI